MAHRLDLVCRILPARRPGLGQLVEARLDGRFEKSITIGSVKG
jgi:hypothetical protein